VALGFRIGLGQRIGGLQIGFKVGFYSWISLTFGYYSCVKVGLKLHLNNS
jgi:hypothetical protein